MRPGSEPHLPNLALETTLYAGGARSIAGLDEVGRGAWAGPLTAAAVILPIELTSLPDLLRGVRDSKCMTPRQRLSWSRLIFETAREVGVGEATPSEVDSLGPLAATRLAMARALESLSRPAEHLLVDHLRLPELATPQSAITHGDATVLSIAAASVVAKALRDQQMVELDHVYPGYGFARHKGYGTSEHLDSLRRLGPSPIHRLSYAPVAALAAALF
jgi:ribonuclease HII